MPTNNIILYFNFSPLTMVEFTDYDLCEFACRGKDAKRAMEILAEIKKGNDEQLTGKVETLLLAIGSNLSEFIRNLETPEERFSHLKTVNGVAEFDPRVGTTPGTTMLYGRVVELRDMIGEYGINMVPPGTPLEQREDMRLTPENEKELLKLADDLGAITDKIRQMKVDQK